MPSRSHLRRIVLHSAMLSATAAPMGCFSTSLERIALPPATALSYSSQPQIALPPDSIRAQVGGSDPAALQKKPSIPSSAEIPRGIPGAEKGVPLDPPQEKVERRKFLERLFPELEPLGPEPVVDLLPGQHAMSLEELQDYARKNSPLIQQAEAEIERTRGMWIQAGLYPNPTVGFQGDQVGNKGSAGQIGSYFNQTIVTAHKLKISQSVAYYDYENAKLRMRKAEADLARDVRADYYGALVAAEGVRVSRLVYSLTERLYKRQVTLAVEGEQPAFEANALRAQVGQVKSRLIQSRQQYLSSWRKLAATLNAPDMAATPLAGAVDAAAPRYQFEAIRDYVLERHTELAFVRNLVTQAESAVLLERKRIIPDIQNQFYFQDDSQNNTFQMGIQIGVQVPLFNRNQGHILAARATLAKYSREGERIRNDLIRQLADAFGRYEASREQIELYREQILPDLVQAFRGVTRRFEGEPKEVIFNDIVTAEQNLANQLGNYIQLLDQQWQAASDLAGVAQAIELGELLKGGQRGEGK